MTPLSYALLTALAVIYGLYRVLQVGKRDPRMPKGPPTLPILGNVHQIPSSGLYKQYVECWSIPIRFQDEVLYTQQPTDCHCLMIDSGSGLRNMVPSSP